MTPLNGDAKVLFDKIDELEEDVKQRHLDNKETTSLLFKKIDLLKDKCSDLPCKAHIEKFKSFDNHILEGEKWRLAIFSLAVGLIVTLGSGLATWGAMQQKLDDHIRYTEKGPHK